MTGSQQSIWSVLSSSAKKKARSLVAVVLSWVVRFASLLVAFLSFRQFFKRCWDGRRVGAGCVEGVFLVCVVDVDRVLPLRFFFLLSVYSCVLKSISRSILLSPLRDHCSCRPVPSFLHLCRYGTGR